MASTVPEGGSRGRLDDETPAFVLDFRAVLDSFADAVVAAEPDDRVVYLNRSAEVLLGWEAADLIGRPLWTIVPERLRPAHRAAFRRFVDTGEARLVGIPVLLPALRQDGSEQEIELTIGYVQRDEGPLVIASLRDVSDRIELERHNALTRRLLEVIADAPTLAEATPRILAGICEELGWQVGALWTLDRDEHTISCEELWYDADDPAPTFADATLATKLTRGVGLPGMVWEEKQPRWMFDVENATNFVRAPAALADGLHAAFAFPVEVEGRFLGVLEFFSTDVREPDPDLLETMATIGAELGRFIERRRRDDAALLQNALLASQNENTLEGILVVAADGTMISHNRRFAEMWGLPQDVMATGADEAALAAAAEKVLDPDAFLARVADLYARRDARGRDEIRLRDGRVFDRYTAPLEAPDGSYVGRAWYTRDVTAERVAEQRLAESSMRYRHLAKTLQQNLLPPRNIEIPGAEVATLYEPVGEGNTVGGDFYDVFEPRQGEWAIVVGDVCGKGVEAAAITSLVRYTIRALAMKGAAPDEVLRDTNAAMLMEGVDDRFCTVSYARLARDGDGFSACITIAGNPLPLVVRARGKVESAGALGLPLGLFPEPAIEACETHLGRGDTLVLLTDGVTDTGGDRHALGDAGLATLLADAAPEGAQGIVDRIRRMVTHIGVGERRDDCALVALKVR